MPPGDDSFALTYWQQFVAALVQHLKSLYGGSYSRSVAGLEVWSEENGQMYWTTTDGPNPARYSRVLCRAYDGARAADPNLPVILGGLSYEDRSQPGNVYTIPDFMDRAYATRLSGTDIRKCMTDVGLHPQGVPDADIKSPDDPTGYFQRSLVQMRQATSYHHDVGRHMAFTEFGYYTGPITPAQQAAWDTESYNLVNQIADLDFEIINTLFDVRVPGGVMTWGMCARPGSTGARPVATALKLFLRGESAKATC
jgi:hypothetical protein